MRLSQRTAATWLRSRVRRLARNLGVREDTFLVALAILIGLGTGLGAVGFDWLVIQTEEFCFTRLVDPTRVLDGTGWMLLVALPAIGGLLVGLIHVAFSARGKQEAFGVPEVIDAISSKEGRIPARVSVTTAASASLTIGSGGSAGPEGPIIAIGASIGSTIGRLFRVHRRHMAVLVGCGIAGGISSIFSAPIAGVLFTLEIFLLNFSFRTFTPVVISSVVSATISRTIAGDEAILQLSRDVRYSFQWWELGNYVVLGVLAGLVSVAFIALLFGTTDFFRGRLKRVPRAVRPAIGGLGVGLLGLGLLLAMPDGRPPAIFGRGYPFIRDMMDPSGHLVGASGLTVALLALLLGAKLLGTSLTLGSGGNGGTFAPALFLGATVGGLLALLLQRIFPAADINPIAYAAVGMVAVLAGTVHAYLTAIVLLFEMTQDYHMLLPAMLAVTVATAVSQLIRRHSVYIEALDRQGIRLGLVADLTLLRGLYVEQLPLVKPVFVHEDDPLGEVIRVAASTPVADFVVLDHAEHYRGMLVAEDLRVALLEREAVPLLLARELLRADIPLVHPQESLATLHDKFSRNDLDALPVVNPDDGERVVGLVTRSAMMRRYQQELLARPGYGARATGD